MSKSIWRFLLPGPLGDKIVGNDRGVTLTKWWVPTGGRVAVSGLGSGAVQQQAARANHRRQSPQRCRSPRGRRLGPGPGGPGLGGCVGRRRVGGVAGLVGAPAPVLVCWYGIALL